MILDEIQRRVLGVLVEKSLAQPQYYPMTVNAITAGCNQKSNRDPVMELDEDTVYDTLEVLRAGGLVSRVLPGGASRVERFRHELKERFAWEKPTRAVVAELLLRGPQTVGELRGHCARMFPFESADAVYAVLEALQNADPPWVAPLPRAPGQAATRYAHCLYPPEEWAQLGFGAAAPAGRANLACPPAPSAAQPGATNGLNRPPAGAPPASPPGVTSAPAGRLPVGEPDLRASLTSMRDELTRLAGDVDALRNEIDALRRLLETRTQA